MPFVQLVLAVFLLKQLGDSKVVAVVFGVAALVFVLMIGSVLGSAVLHRHESVYRTGRSAPSWLVDRYR